MVRKITKRRERRTFGAIRQLPSGRYQAHYIDPDKIKRIAPQTFDTREDAEAWLTDARRDISGGTWEPPVPPVKPVELGEYADSWLADRQLQPRTRDHYESLLANQIKPTFEFVPVRSIEPPMIRAWHASLGTRTPTLRAHAYSLLRAVLKDAVHDGLLAANPAVIRGGGSAKKKHVTKPATLDELATITGAMPERYRALVLIAAWCALRFGELVELRRSDIDLKEGKIKVRRGAVRVKGEVLIDRPKTESSIRDVAIPPHLVPVLRAHLEQHSQFGRDGLVFPAADGKGTLAPSTLYKCYYPARKKAGRGDLRFHDLRHTGATLAAATGATLAELMSRLGHSTPGAALRYQHAAQDRDQIIAERLSALAEGRA